MSRRVGVAAMLPESDPKDLAIRALARSATISDLSARHGVSRKFVYQQARKAGAALDDVFLSGAPEDEVLFQLTVTQTSVDAGVSGSACAHRRNEHCRCKGDRSRGVSVLCSRLGGIADCKVLGKPQHS